MNKFTLNVPLGLHYISDWPEFRELIPYTKFILNKVYPGCGMTTYFLTAPYPVIMAAPRKKLLENKSDQMNQDGIRHYYFEASTSHDQSKRTEETKQKIKEMMDYIHDGYTPFQGRVFWPKILVTFDSLPVVYRALYEAGKIDNFTLLVDEFHVSFIDFELKRDVIERFFSVTQMINNVIFLSATPIMEEYLDRMDVFKDLPYVELEWDSSMVHTPSWQYHSLKSTLDAAKKIIEDFKRDGIFDSITLNGRSYNSSEAVFFINDVRNILNIIKECQLRPDEVNILIADTTENKKTINTILGRNAGYCIGDIPLKGRPHKTYTFCSKTVFFGCDFYSTNASTYVFADANLQNMTTDIALDLPQIAGRQREGNNPFKDIIHIYVKYNTMDVQEYNEFKNSQQQRVQDTDIICSEWSCLSQKSLEAIKVKQKVCPYGVIYRDATQGDQWIVKKSENAIVAEDRAWKLRNKIYVNNEVFTCLLQNNGFNVQQGTVLPDDISNFYTSFLICDDPSMKMQMYCRFFDQNPGLRSWADILSKIPAEYKNYYNSLGSAEIARYSYSMTRIKPIYEYYVHEWDVMIGILKAFKPGEAYRKEDIKAVLQEIYNAQGLKKTAKATDLYNYFDLEESVITKNGIRKKAFKIKNYNERTVHAIQEYKANHPR